MSEAAEIKRDGARAQKNSGRGKHQKGDATLGPFCYDIKEYPKGFTVTQAAWLKIRHDAFSAGRKVPALKLVIGALSSKNRLWVIEDEMFKEMLEAWEEKYGKEIND